MTAFLVAVQGEAGRFDIDGHMVGRMTAMFDKQVHHKIVHGRKIGHDLACLVRNLTGCSQFQSIECALARQWLTIGGGSKHPGAAPEAGSVRNPS